MAKKPPQAFEVNFDGLVGPTHNYSGLSFGNIASTGFRGTDSNPREAVLQGLAKMKALADLGLRQGLLPPQERPDLPTLRRLGFSGNDKTVLADAALQAPELLSAIYSASSMWTANAATVSPSADTEDRKVHFTPANLISKFHRSLEAPLTSLALRKIFKGSGFVHHEALIGGPAMGDEGAANHTRLCSEYGGKGLEFFVFGRYGLREGGVAPRKFPARQTFEASAAVARSHRLADDAVVFAQQNPEAIDAGVFHNDVAGVGNQNVYFYHEQAYLNSGEVMSELRKKFHETCGGELKLVEVPASKVSMGDAVKSYLFNSQLLTLPSGQMALFAPVECRENPSVERYLGELTASNSSPFREVRYLDLRQSMRNGGGPACLRLRVVLTEKELKSVQKQVLMTDKLHGRLVVWARRHYRDRMVIDDLRDPALWTESRAALDQLTQVLGLGALYPFQR